MKMESSSVENIVRKFEQAVGSADGKLDRMGWYLSKLELEKVHDAIVEEGSNGTCDVDAYNEGEVTNEETAMLMELLTTLNKIKEDHANLVSELQQVRTMHADLTQALRENLTQVQSGFSSLRTRVAKNPKSNA